MHRRLRNLLLILLAVIVPAGAYANSTVRAPRYLQGHHPEPGEEHEVTVGEAIYTKFDYVEYYGAKLPAGYRADFMLGRIFIPAGVFLMEQPSKRGVQYCTRDKDYKQGRILEDIVCFRDANKDGKFELIRVPNLRFGGWAKIKKSPPVPYVEDIDHEQSNGFRQDLLYQGIDGDTIKISYREFSGSLARPAFQQDLTYTLQPEGETEIAFKGARITVHEASNTTIRFAVVSGIP